MAKRKTKLLIGKEKLQHRESVIKQFLAGQISVEETMQRLKLSHSSVYRIDDRYVQGDRQALKYGNQNQPPSNKLDDKQRERILELLEVKYANFQLALAIEYLEKALRSSEKPYLASCGKYYPQRRLQSVVWHTVCVTEDGALES